MAYRKIEMEEKISTGIKNIKRYNKLDWKKRKKTNELFKVFKTRTYKPKKETGEDKV
jgi:hypothetical protein